MARQLSVKTGVKIDSVANITQQLQKQLDMVSKNLNVNIGKVDITNISKAIEDINVKVEGLSRNKVKITPNVDTTVATNKLNEYAETVKQKTQQLSSDIGKVSKVSVTTNGEGKFIGATLVEQLDNAKQRVTKLREDLEVISKTDVDNIGKAKTDSYKISSDLQKQEYDIKTKLINAEGEYKTELERTLSVVKKIKEENGTTIKKNGLTDAELENKLLVEKEALVRKVNLEQAKANTRSDSKFTKDLETQNRYLDQQISKLKIYKQSVESRGGGKPESQANLVAELDKQILKMNQLKNSSNILGQAEKTRISETTNSMKVQTNELVRYQSSFSNIFKKMTNYALGGSIIYGGIAQIRQGINDIVSLDTAMRDLGKVARATNEELKAFPQVANEIAISIGTSTEGVIKATEYYSRLGYSIQEASERAKQATIFGNVGDMSAEQASKALITVQKGYGLETLDDMKKASDVMNAIGNNFSTSTEGVANALSRSASSLKSANNSLEESVALVVAGNNAIQDPESVGTALKTLSMRLRGMKVELEDGQVPLSKLREELIAIANVDIMEKDGTSFKSTYDIMKQLSEVYPKLTESQRAWITQQVSGVRQANIMDGLLYNMADGVKAYETALNSSGSVMQEQERYMNSIQGRVNEFTETLKKVWVDAINTDSIKGIVDLGTGLLNVLDGLINTFGVIPTVIGGATMALAIFNKEMYNSMIGSIPLVSTLNNKFTSMANNIGNAVGDKIINAFIGFSASMKTATGQSAMLATGNMALSASLKAVEISSMLAGVALTMGLSIVITAVVGWVTKLADSLIMTKKELLEFNKESTNMAQTNSKTISSAEGLQSKIADINDKISKTTDLSERSKLTSELAEAQKQLADVLPESATGINSQGEAISNNNAIVQESIRLKREELKLNAMEFAKNNKNSSRGEEFRKTREEYEKLVLAYKNGKGYDKEYTQNYNGMAQVKQSIKIEVDKSDLDDGKKKLQEFNDYYSQLAKQVNALKQSGFSASEIEDILPNSASELAYYNTVLSETESKSDKAKDGTSRLGDGLNDLTMSADEAKNAMKDLGEAFGGYSDKLEFLNKIQKEFAETGGLTDNSITTLISKYGDLAYLLTDQANFQKNLQGEIGKTTESYNKSYDEIIKNARIANGQIKQEHADKVNSILNNEEEFANYLGSIYDQDTRNYVSALRAKLKTYQQYIDSKSNLSQYDTEFIDDHRLQQSIKFAEKYANELDRIIGVTSGVNKVSVGSVRPVSPTGSGNKDKDKEKEVQDLDLKINRYRELENALKNVNNAIAYNETLMKNASDKEKIDLLKEQAFLYERQREALIALRNEQTNEKNESKNTLANNGFSFEGDKLVGANARLQALQRWANSLSGQAKEDAINRVKELESIVSLYDSLVTDKIPNSNKEISDINNQIVQSQKEIADILKKQKDDFIKAEQDKTNALKLELQKRKDLLSNQFKEEDYQDKIADSQQKLNELESSLQNAIRSNDQVLADSLRKQIEAQRLELNNAIRDNERDNALTTIDKDIENADKELQDKIDNINKNLTDDKVLELVQQGVVDLSNVLNNIGDSTKTVRDTFVGVGTILQDEWVGSIREFKTEVESIKTDLFNVPQLGVNINPNTQGQKTIGNIDINIPITVQGNMDENTLEKLEDKLDNFKDEVIKEIADAMKR